MSIPFETLIGKTLVKIVVADGKEAIDLHTDDEHFRMMHYQDCCETVEVESIVGDISDLIGSPITMAEEVSNSDEPSPSEYSESHTWTFYKLATVKGYVDIRWIGESNGYYSESVSFERIG